MKTMRSCVLFFVVLFFIGFTLFVSCGKNDISDQEEHISDKTDIELIDNNKTISSELTDKDFLELVYDRNYKYPDGFYFEKDLTGSVYYENTLSIRLINERGEDCIELHTLNKEEARNWSNLSNEYSSVNRIIIKENETEKYFEFVRKSVNNYYGDDILLSRIHKSDYFIPVRNLSFLHGYGLNKDDIIGIFKKINKI